MMPDAVWPLLQFVNHLDTVLLTDSLSGLKRFVVINFADLELNLLQPYTPVAKGQWLVVKYLHF